jgi:subtilisin-like proprotein convertase family protein
MLRSVWLLAAVVAVAGACLVAPALAGAATFSNGTPITIPAGAPGTTIGPATPYPSAITVSGLKGIVTDVNVTLNGLSHSFIADVGVLLVGPTGENVVLMNFAGSGPSSSTLTFDDAASASLPFLGPLPTGTYKPTSFRANTFSSPAPGAPYGSALSAFDDTDPNGTWRLYVQDFDAVDVGSMGGWSLDITAANPVVFNASLCVNGGWQHLMRANGTAFQSQFHCTQYAAFHGTIYELSQIHVTASAVQPADGLSVSKSGFGLEPGSAVVTRILQNGQQVAFNSLNADANGQVDGSPFGFINAPCVDGNVYSATATGTSADSLSIPKAPGIPITSNTVMRTSSCP